MPASRLVQWVPQIRVPRTPLGRSTIPVSLLSIQWRQGSVRASAQSISCSVVGRFLTSTVRDGNKPRRNLRSAKGTSASSSIFDQLFPLGQVPVATPPHTGSTGQHLTGHTKTQDRLVSNQITGQDDAVIVEEAANVNQDVLEFVNDPAAASPNEPAVLVVRNGSRSSLPSDFYRVTPRGMHLGGRAWSTMQAIQARDPDTMEPLDKYLLYFSSVAEATAYKQELERLTTLEDTAEDRARMTIAPPDPSTMTVELVQGTSAVQQIPGSRHSKDILRHSLDTRNIVFMKLDGHQLTLKELKGLINADGERRNLAWKLSSSWGKGGIAVSLKGEVPRAAPPASTDTTADPETNTPEHEAATLMAGLGSWREKPRETYFSKFFLSFHTVHDARRFIRSWHKRRLSIKDDESRVSVVNASLIW
ncbi:hypothetical protein jhhlp_003562 [Lomentospora prolificans]|uniref:Uncharacterized protein n=1 Tax=Lomentospora prolificans TaxID=41688 RepID=A0A2N3N933_9PEZI|nr:hypothetical protein jhhlp_003562 [Lomentospora prolificans]